MPLVITDKQLAALKMDERNARMEIACRLFDAEQLSLPSAAKNFSEFSRRPAGVLSRTSDRVGLTEYRDG